MAFTFKFKSTLLTLLWIVSFHAIQAQNLSFGIHSGLSIPLGKFGNSGNAAGNGAAIPSIYGELSVQKNMGKHWQALAILGRREIKTDMHAKANQLTERTQFPVAYGGIVGSSRYLMYRVALGPAYTFKINPSWHFDAMVLPGYLWVQSPSVQILNYYGPWVQEWGKNTQTWSVSFGLAGRYAFKKQPLSIQLQTEYFYAKAQFSGVETSYFNKPSEYHSFSQGLSQLGVQVGIIYHLGASKME